MKLEPGPGSLSLFQPETDERREAEDASSGSVDFPSKFQRLRFFLFAGKRCLFLMHRRAKKVTFHVQIQLIEPHRGTGVAELSADAKLAWER